MHLWRLQGLDVFSWMKWMRKKIPHNSIFRVKISVLKPKIWHLHFHRIWKKMLVKVSFWSKERCWLPTNSLDFNSFFPPTTIWAMSNESPARRAAISRLNELNVEKSVISLHIWGWNCNLHLLLQRLKSSCFWNLFFNKASLFKKRKVNTIQ